MCSYVFLMNLCPYMWESVFLASEYVSVIVGQNLKLLEES